MSDQRSRWHFEAMPLLVNQQDVPDSVVDEAFHDFAKGNFNEIEAASFLTALRIKGESASEVASAVRVLRESMIGLRTNNQDVLDTCGTGGDGTGSFNISTAVAIIVAASGVAIVKHGNRSVSSRSGSADVLARLGVNVECGPDWAQRCLTNVGFAFCFAPHFHPALAKIASLRRRLGVRTIFNLLGPLLNPAGATHQLIGVSDVKLLETISGAIANLGTKNSLVVRGRDGLDEITLTGQTDARRIVDGQIEKLVLSPDDFGLEPVSLDEIKADGPEESASIIRQVLDGRPGASRRIVVANAAAGLWVAGRVNSLTEGVALAEDVIDRGEAKKKLDSIANSR